MMLDGMYKMLLLIYHTFGSIQCDSRHLQQAYQHSSWHCGRSTPVAEKARSCPSVTVHDPPGHHQFPQLFVAHHCTSQMIGLPFQFHLKSPNSSISTKLTMTWVLLKFHHSLAPSTSPCSFSNPSSSTQTRYTSTVIKGWSTAMTNAVGADMYLLHSH